MNRLEKKETVASLQEDFLGASTIVVVHYTGLNAEEIYALRQKVRKLGAGFKVTKNKLAKLAVKGTKYEKLADQFKGPTAVAYSSDPVSAAKSIVEFAKNNEKLVIVGGAIGDELMDAGKIDALAKLPSLDELRAKIIRMIQTPATRIAAVLQAPGGQVARVVSAHAQKN